MDDVSSQNSPAPTGHPPLSQQQQQSHNSAATMYHAGAIGWPVRGTKVLPRDYSACEFADLVELIGMFCPRGEAEPPSLVLDELIYLGRSYVDAIDLN
jgi:hypothetical protein